MGRRLSIRLGRVQKFELVEVEQLSEEVLKRMKKLQPDADATHEKWVAAEFRYPLRSLLIKAGRNSMAFATLSLVVVVGGFATSGLAVAGGAEKGSAVAWGIFLIGLIVALAGGISQIFRFGIRSNARRTLALNLREEGWSFVYRDGDYADGGEPSRKFRARVTDIQRRVADVARIDSDTQAGSSSGAGQVPAKNSRVPAEKEQGETPAAVAGDGAGTDDAR
jgi:hypothetical protein